MLGLMVSETQRLKAIELWPARVKRYPVMRQRRRLGETFSLTALAKPPSPLAASPRSPTPCRCLVKLPLLDSGHTAIRVTLNASSPDVLSNSPAANTKAAATSSLAVLLVSLLTSLVEPWSSFLTAATARLAASRDRERAILCSGAQRPNVERRLRPSANTWDHLARDSSIVQFGNPKTITD